DQFFALGPLKNFDLVVAHANKDNRTLEIDAEGADQLILDFRAVSQELGFTFKKDDDDPTKVVLEIERKEQNPFPGLLTKLVNPSFEADDHAPDGADLLEKLSLEDLLGSLFEEEIEFNTIEVSGLNAKTII